MKVKDEIERAERVRENWKAAAEAATYRVEILRALARWVLGKEPPPDGATRADVCERGPTWRGWDWTRRGVEVSPGIAQAMFDSSVKASVVIARQVAEAVDHAQKHDECDARAGGFSSGYGDAWRKVAAAWESVAPFARNRVFDEEVQAWRVLCAAFEETRRTLPLAEIEAARARLEAEAVEQQGAAVVGAKVEENDKAKPPAGRGTGKRGKRAAIKIEVAAAYMKKGTRTLQRWEKNPGLVPDEWAGYSRDVRMTGTNWEAWKVSLGMREGTQGQLRNAAKRLGDGWSSTHTTRC